MYENTYWFINANTMILIRKYVFVCAVFNTKNYSYSLIYTNIKHENVCFTFYKTKTKRMWNINQLLRKNAIFCVLKIFTNKDKEDEKYAKNEEGKMS